MTSITDPTALFPHPELDKLPSDAKPTLPQIRTLQRQINSNAMAVTSTRGGGGHGHLALVMLPGDYNAIPNTAPWIAPVHPGMQPVIPQGATGPQISAITRQYKADLEEYLTYKATEAALRKALIQAIPPIYIDILADDIFAFANVTPEQIVTHMKVTYGQITPDDLAANMDTLKQPWNPNEPIESLWTRIRKCMTFAQAHDPISDQTAVREAVHIFEQTGVFADALRDWRKKLPGDQTLATLTTDFNKANKERQRNLTSQQAGYHSANAAHDNKENASSNADVGLFYCWTHGLGRNPKHTSATCSNTKKP